MSATVTIFKRGVDALRRTVRWIAKALSGCDHDYVYFDEAGNRLAGFGGMDEACFRRCVHYGRTEVNPLGFQSHASFDTYLSLRERGESRGDRKVGGHTSGTSHSSDERSG